VFTVPSPLPEDPATLQRLVLAAAAEIERLPRQLAGLQRNRSGRRSERRDDETLQQAMEDAEPSLPRPRTEPAKRNRGALPVHLVRDERVSMSRIRPAPAAMARCI
jgi:hypothetical protein